MPDVICFLPCVMFFAYVMFYVVLSHLSHFMLISVFYPVLVLLDGFMFVVDGLKIVQHHLLWNVIT